MLYNILVYCSIDCLWLNPNFVCFISRVLYQLRIHNETKDISSESISPGESITTRVVIFSQLISDSMSQTMGMLYLMNCDGTGVV